MSSPAQAATLTSTGWILSLKVVTSRSNHSCNAPALFAWRARILSMAASNSIRDTTERKIASGETHSRARQPRDRQVRADRQLQGSPRIRHDLDPAPARGDPAARRQFRKRRRCHRGLCPRRGEDQGQDLVPSYTQPGKTVQMRAYGAEVELI